jgi:hypothetical protein
MGGLKPIGSEKLEGMDKIRRIMEIARYNENIPNPINETKSTEYSANLADGQEYFIVKERLGYIIKKGLNESTSDYIDTIQSRKYYPSYSQALKRLNLMSKELNTLHGNEEGMSLFTEQKKKFKLKLPGKGKPAGETETPSVPVPETPTLPPPPVADMPSPSAGDEVSDTPPMGMEGGVEIPPSDSAMGVEPPADGADETSDTPPMDMEGDEPMGDMEEPPMDDEDAEDEKPKKDEGTSFKVIQKLTGKLAQKIRKFNSGDDMDPNDVKYIINSILSALDVDLLDDDDIEEIISRLEGDFEEEDEEDTEDEGDIKDEEPPLEDEETPEPPTAPEGGEMSEYAEIDEVMSLSDALNKSVGSKYSGEVYDSLTNLPSIETKEEYGHHGARKPRHTYNHLSHGTFGESKADKILSKYFTTTKSEIISEERKRLKLLEEIEAKKERNFKSAIKLSETVKQKRAVRDYIEKNPTSKLLGKTNKGSLVFSEGIVKTKITKNGLVI